MTRKKMPSYEDVLNSSRSITRLINDWSEWWDELEPGEVRELPGDTPARQRTSWDRLRTRLKTLGREDEAVMSVIEGTRYVARVKE